MLNSKSGEMQEIRSSPIARVLSLGVRDPRRRRRVHDLISCRARCHLAGDGERESRHRGRKVGLSQPAGRRNRFPFLPHFLPAPSPACSALVVVVRTRKEVGLARAVYYERDRGRESQKPVLLIRQPERPYRLPDCRDWHQVAREEGGRHLCYY